MMQSLGLRSVDLSRGPGGFGFTLSSQGPCVLSCILTSSPAHRAGLRPGDQILYVNGSSVEKYPHEQVVKLIARSPNGVVSLGVKNRAHSIENLTAQTKYNENSTEKENLANQNILNSVDKVVQELKSGQIPLHKQQTSLTTSDEQAISEDEIASDEELKASFIETFRSDSSCDSVFIEHQRLAEDELKPIHKQCNYRGLSQWQDVAVTDHHEPTSDTPLLTAVVGYLGSIELPGDSSLQKASLTAIRSCVRRLRAQQKVHVVFLLEVSVLGIRLIDNNGKTIVTYPSNSLAFTGVCADDQRVFGVVTKKVQEESTNSNSRLDLSSSVNCSCHVFTVDPEISLHNDHTTIAAKFHIECNPVNGKCTEFLESSSPILHAIDDLFVDKKDTQFPISSKASIEKMDIEVESAEMAETDPIENKNSVNGNDSIIATPQQHNIDVQVTECPDSQSDSEWTSPENEPFRHRVVQIEHVRPSYSNKDKRSSLSKEKSSKDELSEINIDGGYGFGKMPPIKINEPGITVTQMNAKKDSRLSNSHAVESGRMRLSHSAENLAHNELDSVESSNLSLNPSVHSSSHSIHSTSSMPEDSSSIHGRVARWALGFDKLMEDPSGLKCFQEFLKKEFSEENIMFWVACEEFRHMTSEKELKAEAVNIFEAHLSSNATMPVNIDSLAVKQAEENLSNPSNDMYILQQQQVYTLMKFDSYPRFLKSDVYRQSLVADMEGLPLPFDEDKPEKGRFFKKRSTRGWGRRSSKKSSSSYEESKSPSERKKSFLPWKGKQPKTKAVNKPFDSQPSSTRSSLSSLSDSFPSMSYSNESLEVRRESDSFQFCRVILPDHSSTIITAKQGQTLRHALVQLCERRHMSLITSEVYIAGVDKPVQDKQLDVDVMSLAGKEITLEHRSLFRIEISKSLVFLIKSKPDQSIRAAVEPILSRYDVQYSTVKLHLVGCEVPLDGGTPVASIEYQYVIVKSNELINGNNNGPPKIKPPAGFSSPRRSIRRGSSIDDSIFDDIMRGKKQSLGNGYFDDAGVWVPGLKPFRSQESLNDESFGKSFLRGQGLFSKRRKEAIEKEKAFNKLARNQGNNKKNTEVTELLDLLTRAQGKRMDDQRGELGKHDFELPDFLRVPSNNETEKSTFPPPPPPPPSMTSRHTTGSLKLRGENRPSVRKTISSPAVGGDFMTELSDKIRRRSTSDDLSIPEGRDVEDSSDTSPGRSNSSSSDKSPWEPRSDRYRRINTVRPRTTDGAVFTVEAVTPVRLDRPLSSAGVTMSHSESMPDTLQSRTRSTQPLTAVRGLSSMGNMKMIDETKGTNQAYKYNSKQRTLSSSSAPDYSTNLPYVYEAEPIDEREKPRPSIKRHQSDGVTGNAKGTLSPFHIPQMNSRKTEVFVPSTSGIKPYRIMNSESKSRPRPITDSAELMAGLEEDSNIPPIVPPPPPCDLLPTRLSPSMNSASPLPYPLSPGSDQIGELEIANFPPPTPLSNMKGGKASLAATPSDEFNKTLTPGTCERTFVEEHCDEGTPYGTHRSSKNDRKSGKEIPQKLDPYVTYESEDMRITFV